MTLEAPPLAWVVEAEADPEAAESAALVAAADSAALEVAALVAAADPEAG